MLRAIGDYIVSSVISPGPMTEVLSVHSVDPTVVGIGKRLTPRFRGDPAALAQFETEQEVLRVLDGRGGPRLLAAGHDAEGPWVVMERIALRPMSTLAALEKRARVAVVAGLARACFDALAEIHEAGDERGPLEIVHGDVSPDNVLVGDGTEEARFVDFGLASFRDRRAPSSGSFRGTIDYVAPEVARGENATPASDLFALGLTLLHVSSGVTPRGSTPVPSRLVQAAEEPVLDYAKRASVGLPSELCGVLLSMVELDPKARLGSAREAWRRASW